MMVYGARDLARAFRTVRTNTITIAEEIPETKYGFSAAPGVRSVGQLLTHIALTSRFQLAVHQPKITDLKTFDFPKVMGEMQAEEQKSRSKNDIIALLKAEGERFASWVETLDDSFLAESVGMMGEPPSKTRFEMLMSAKEHEMHHRGQLMLMQRLVGIVPHLTRRREEQMAARR